MPRRDVRAVQVDVGPRAVGRGEDDLRQAARPATGRWYREACGSPLRTGESLRSGADAMRLDRVRPHRTISRRAHALYAMRHRTERALSETLPVVYLARHGETAWSLAGRHTGRTDCRSPSAASAMRARSASACGAVAFARVYTSPLQRAARTCELAGFGDGAKAGRRSRRVGLRRYEGRRTAEIVAARPGWNLFRDGCPDGEKAAGRRRARGSRDRPRAQPSPATSCCSRARTSCACSPRAGSGCRRRARRCCAVRPRASACSATSTASTNRSCASGTIRGM